MNNRTYQTDIQNISALYEQPFPSTRSGALFNAFSYPTKISPEAEALFIACHTKAGDKVLDPFGGSGTTGIAALLCDKPTEKMKETALKYGLSPQWGPRHAVVYEISTSGCLLGDVMCHTGAKAFEKEARILLDECREFAERLYSVPDDEGRDGQVRHIIWSDVLLCPHCRREVNYSDAAVRYNPLSFSDDGACPHCGEPFKIADADRVKEHFFDPVLNAGLMRKKRVPFKIYGTTGKRKWQRAANEKDAARYQELESALDYSQVPEERIRWGELYRQGYHYGITHIHHFYTSRNAVMFAYLWNSVGRRNKALQDALRIFLLSYNSSHSTLMTRVVAKKGSKDFVLTGAQPGVLYISSLPVEKNIFSGLERKLKTFVEALSTVEKSKSTVVFRNLSSTSMSGVENGSIDYIFTDPPFGAFIPYSEVNQINEIWLGHLTDNSNEAVINEAQGKSFDNYSCLMESVFREMSNKLKPDGRCTLVFHSAKAEIWRAIIKAYRNNGFAVERASVLDKVQKTFKQTNSHVTVKGDPILLLAKSKMSFNGSGYISDKQIAEALVDRSKDIPFSKEKAWALYSNYITACVENGLQVSLDAKYFFGNGESK